MKTNQSKIDQLIQELCPDGVKFNELGDLISRVDGSNRKIVKSKIQATGEYRFVLATPQVM
jgi:hypothetical protein